MAARERQIPLKAHEVRGILEGRQSQVRRVVKPQPPLGHSCLGFIAASTFRAEEGKALWARDDNFHELNRKPHRVRCPFGAPGDRLWVKETYADLTATHGKPWERRNPDTGLYERGRKPFLWYRADGEQPDIGDGRSPVERWRPSIHMPRLASRIDLEVTGVRVERLQDISEDDARSEGCSPVVHDDGAVDCGTRKTVFRALWESINGPDSWTANPWVWVIEFKRIRL